jgi:hypothetical protein
MRCDNIVEQISATEFKHTCSICGQVAIVQSSTLKRTCVPNRPNWIQQATNFTKATKQFIQNNFRKCTEEEIASRLEICKTCELYEPKSENAGICNHVSCGCNLNKERVFLNKLAHANQECPLKKWTRIENPQSENE